MAEQSVKRIIGIDMGTSTTYIRVKRYRGWEPIDGEFVTRSVTFGYGAGDVSTATVIRESKNGVRKYGSEADEEAEGCTVYREFKMNLEHPDREKREEAKGLVQDFFVWLYSIYKVQSSDLGEADDEEHTLVSYPAKWTEETRRFMKQAAENAGFLNVECMDEPSAALYSVLCRRMNELENNGWLRHDRPGYFLLIDMGAGTTDLAVCRYELAPNLSGKINAEQISNEIISSWPIDQDAPTFGGREVDKALEEYLASYLTRSLDNPGRKIDINSLLRSDAVKKWKEQTVSPRLNNGESVNTCAFLSMLSMFLKEKFPAFGRTELETMLNSGLQGFKSLVINCLNDAQMREPALREQGIDLVILTGGHSSWYFAKELLDGTMEGLEMPVLSRVQKEKNRVICLTNPQETVALGLVYSLLPFDVQSVVDEDEDEDEENHAETQDKKNQAENEKNRTETQGKENRAGDEKDRAEAEAENVSGTFDSTGTDDTEKKESEVEKSADWKLPIEIEMDLRMETLVAKNILSGSTSSYVLAINIGTEGQNPGIHMAVLRCRLQKNDARNYYFQDEELSSVYRSEAWIAARKAGQYQADLLDMKSLLEMAVAADEKLRTSLLDMAVVHTYISDPDEWNVWKLYMDTMILDLDTVAKNTGAKNEFLRKMLLKIKIGQNERYLFFGPLGGGIRTESDSNTGADTENQRTDMTKTEEKKNASVAVNQPQEKKKVNWKKGARTAGGGYLGGAVGAGIGSLAGPAGIAAGWAIGAMLGGKFGGNMAGGEKDVKQDIHTENETSGKWKWDPSLLSIVESYITECQMDRFVLYGQAKYVIGDTNPKNKFKPDKMISICGAADCEVYMCVDQSWSFSGRKGYMITDKGIYGARNNNSFKLVSWYSFMNEEITEKITDGGHYCVKNRYIGSNCTITQSLKKDQATEMSRKLYAHGMNGAMLDMGLFYRELQQRLRAESEKRFGRIGG